MKAAATSHPRAAGGCGCLAPPRWHCEHCPTPWLACSRDCLQRHVRKRHAEAAGDRAIVARVARQQADLNRQNAGNWDSFAPHRERLTRLLCALQRADGLCVLGAGNGDDLDLGVLVREFQEVHLVDLDVEALGRAAARLPGPARPRVHLHGGVDLSGLLDTVESWGDRQGALAVDPAAAAEAIAGPLGRRFDVVLSSAVLSQLCVPLYRHLARQAAEWQALMALVGQIHLHTMAALLRPGGTGVLVGDVLYGRRVPGDPAPAISDWQSLPADVVERLSDGVARLRNPAFLLQLLQTPPRADVLEDVRVTDPWLWSVEQADMLAYAVIFRRRE